MAFLLSLLLLPSEKILACCSEENILRSPNYASDQIPVGENGSSLLVTSSINLRNIIEIAETKQQISLETTLRFFWFDTRLKPRLEAMQGKDSFGTYVNLHPRVANSIWMPDIFIDQAISLRQPTYFTQPASLRLYNSSMIRYSSRLNYDVACTMDFRRFPFDSQVCTIKFESFSYSTDQMQLQWRERSASQVNPGITLDQFALAVELEDNYQTDTYDLEYPGLIMTISLSRDAGFHLLQTYLQQFGNAKNFMICSRHLAKKTDKMVFTIES